MDNSVLSGKRVLAVCMETTAGGKNYSGGLGALYGDTTRTMYRLKKNYLAVTPIYTNGYVQQEVTENGVIDEYPPQDLNQEYKDTGIVLSVPILNQEVKVRVWQNRELPIHYGLDTSFPENGILANITNNLYGENGIGPYDGEAQRMMQEVILGVGSILLCRKLGFSFEVLHLNEGHGIFAALHLLQFFREKWGYSFEKALATVKEYTVFTTHTPIGAGNKSRPIQMMLDFHVNQGLTYEELKYIGASDNESLFGSTVAALRLSHLANAVAFRHQETSRELWKHVDRACPIIYIDNGIDLVHWQDIKIREAYENHSYSGLRIAHRVNKRILIQEIAKRNHVLLDENAILIGFARRVIEYKRANLIFYSIQKFEELVNRYHLQIVFSGKTHPKDYQSKQILQLLHDMAKKYPQNIVFLQNYDAEVTALMTKGCDVWLGNPRIPLEACSTSGMKAACNGVLNLSTADGWWYKSAKDYVNGWTIGKKSVLDEINRMNISSEEKIARIDAADAKSLYEVLEQYVLPTFENSKKWAKMMMASIYMAEKDCSTERMCEDYYHELYEAPTIL